MRNLLLIFLLFILAAPARAEDALEVERRTEAFAHELLELAAAWRREDAEAMARHFAPNLAASVWPETMGPPRGQLVGAIRHDAPKHRESAPSTEVARNLIAFARAHGEVKHISLKPIGNDLVYPAKFEVIGELPDGRRIWTKGKAYFRVAEGKIDSIHLQAMKTLASRRRIFRDVGLPGTDPAVLDHPTLGLAAYGAAAADVNGDGKVDVFTTGHEGNVLHLNEGDGKFRAVSVATPRQATAPLFLDYDNDGDLDLFCSANGAQMLLENRDGTFVDVSEKAGVAVESIGFTVTAGDLNGDRVPDIYVAAYNNYGPVAPESWDDAHNGLPNLLFLSNGDGTYTECAEKMGVAGREWSYSCQFLDVTGDGKLDLYVANDFGAGNNLFVREGDRFVDRAREWGVWDGGYGMGVDFGDFDNDGKLDLYVTKMSSTAGNRLLDRTGRIGRLRELASGNSLYRNVGGKFEDTKFAFPAGWAWGGGFIDIDNDGYEDLYSPNGHMSGASEKDT